MLWAADVAASTNVWIDQCFLVNLGGRARLADEGIGESRRCRPQGWAEHGSGALIRWLLENELVDEITLLTYPVVIGQGTRLFPDAGPDIALDLLESRAFPKGITIQVYRPAGRPQYATD